MEKNVYTNEARALVSAGSLNPAHSLGQVFPSG